MNDFLQFLYRSYIQPYLSGLPRDDGDLFRESLCLGDQTEETMKDVEAVVAFAAAHAFLLGLRTGAGLNQNGAL
ncbi:hypothetical protein [Pseudoflavonifractor phocaeensis]|uniref:hypothetical protein n=1 Tax=Pseudoflavonifractor phocaeensis TaxID=1870988 RepID=UPI0019581A3D|nr:hypothetical protein [Pseudoflavonifractor phocaeensis]MBM6925929.1 hypothetical protein [Pseudoflavonifractor phocaeensis]